MLESLRHNTPKHILQVVDYIWNNRDLFIRWPKRAFLLGEGHICRGNSKGENQVHYTQKELTLFKAVDINPITLSNGPAVMAFLVAEGERPEREFSGQRNKSGKPSQRQWSVHHVYDGKFPAPERKTTCHAVKNPQYFTQAAGLVALHPVADALADEVPYFAWLLRYEAFKRFNFDPDSVFTD